MKSFSLLALIVSVLVLIGCSTTSVDRTEGLSASEIYVLAKGYLEDESYTLAIEYFEILESRYPFGVYATQAQLDVAYAYFKYDEPESAIAAADRFIKLHPRHAAVDYAYYLKGLINFGLPSSILDKIHQRELADYDQKRMFKSYQDFQVLVSRFPDSEYVPDAVKRMVFLRNQMARSEIKVAEYYLSRKAWIAAANRASGVVKKYQGSDSIKRALQIQILAYQQLGLSDLEQDARRILVNNYGEEAADISLETDDS